MVFRYREFFFLTIYVLNEPETVLFTEQNFGIEKKLIHFFEPRNPFPNTLSLSPNVRKMYDLI